MPTSAAPVTSIEEKRTCSKHPTLDRLPELGLNGMAKAFEELGATRKPRPGACRVARPAGRREATLRQQKRFETRARTAKLRHDASVEDVDFRRRGGSTERCSCGWPAVTGSPNTAIADHRRERLGKTWLACALGHKACRKTCPTLYHRCRGCLRHWPWPAATDATPG